MLTESFVGLMAMIAAATLEPGVYFAMNVGPGTLGGTAQSAALKIAEWGFMVTPEQMEALAKQMGEVTLMSRTGGAPSLAVGMASVLGGVFTGPGLALWYHFAIMFEALFILTTIDAGTRVGRFMFQELAGHVWKPLGRQLDESRCGAPDLQRQPHRRPLDLLHAGRPRGHRRVRARVDSGRVPPQGGQGQRGAVRRNGAGVVTRAFAVISVLLATAVL